MPRPPLIFLLLVALATTVDATPESVLDTWADFDPQHAPLTTEHVEKWETDEATLRLVRFQLGPLSGSNKSASPIIAAYYGVPKRRDGKLPAIVHLHGGGQRADKHRVAYWNKLGYAAISINWGGKVLEAQSTPNTDWDGLACGFIGDKDQKHHNTLEPGPNTLYAEPHPFNSSWLLIAAAARRALTFLEQQPEVDPERLGVEGHSMGGRATVLTIIDPRVRAASPSVGGTGYLYDEYWGIPNSGRRRIPNQALYNDTIAAQAYWPHVRCPSLFLGATNDFNSPTENVIRGMAKLPATTPRRLALAPHLNHRFTTGTAAARTLWMETQLKGNFAFPQQPQAQLVLDRAKRVPQLRVTASNTADALVDRVEVYYGYGRDPLIRYWRSATVTKVGDYYEADCPVFDANEPLFAFANVSYRTNRQIPMPPGFAPTTDTLSISSVYCRTYPPALKKAGIRATEVPQRLIDDFSRGWQDWYRLNPENPHHWLYATRKIIDPSWTGPKDGKLAFSITTTAPDNTLAVIAQVNAWQHYTGRKKDQFVAFVPLPNSGDNAVAIAAKDFKNASGTPMTDWDEITEINFLAAAKVTATTPPTQENWQGRPPSLANLRWQGGTFIKRPYPHESRGANYADSADAWAQEFQNAIDSSVEQEARDRSKR